MTDKVASYIPFASFMNEKYLWCGWSQNWAAMTDTLFFPKSILSYVISMIPRWYEDRNKQLPGSTKAQLIYRRMSNNLLPLVSWLMKPAYAIAMTASRKCTACSHRTKVTNLIQNPALCDSISWLYSEPDCAHENLFMEEQKIVLKKRNHENDCFMPWERALPQAAFILLSLTPSKVQPVLQYLLKYSRLTSSSIKVHLVATWTIYYKINGKKAPILSQFIVLKGHYYLNTSFRHKFFKYSFLFSWCSELLLHIFLYSPSFYTQNIIFYYS